MTSSGLAGPLAGDEDRGEHGEHVRDPVGVEEERPEVEAVRRRARDVRGDGHEPNNRDRSSSRDHPVELPRSRTARSARGRASRSPPAGASSAIRIAAARSSLTSRGSSSARERERRIRSGRRRGDEPAAVGERLERADPVVLVARRGDEEPRAAEQRAVLGRREPARRAAPRRCVPAGSMPVTISVLARRGGPATTDRGGSRAGASPDRRRRRSRAMSRSASARAVRRARPASGRATTGGARSAAPARASARSSTSTSGASREPPALDRPLPDAVAPGPVLGRERVEPDRSRARPQQRGGDRAVDDRPRARASDRPPAVAARAARAWTRSVSAKVRTWRTGPAWTSCGGRPGAAERGGQLAG